MTKYLKTSRMACYDRLNGGILWLMPEVFIKVCTLIALIFLWRTVMTSGAEVGMTVTQMLSYTFISTILGDMLVVETPATGWLSDGVLMKLYGRPQNVLGQLAAITAGGWAPMLLVFSFPMALLSPLLGVRLVPASLWFFPSLLLCMTLGFAIGMLFACLTIKMRNMSWIISRIRTAVAALLSGTVIPISLLPFGLAGVIKYQPLASLGGAPLTLFAGTVDPKETILIQLFWNAILWPVALAVFRKSEEGLVSYGG